MAQFIKNNLTLYGVKVWAQWYTRRVPKFDVFIYVGYQAGSGLYFFQSHKNPAVMISRNVYQLMTGGFSPFVLDMKAIDLYAKSRGWSGSPLDPPPSAA
jgi:hypothetical protein